jgi:hypothetical protein
MATAAMNGAIYESTFNIFFKLHFEKTYDGILATPMGVTDVAVGEIGWSLMRGTAYAIGFYVVMLLLGLVESAWSVLAIPAAVLIGFAFSAVCMAATTFMTKVQDFDLIAMVQVPLFLFSATFFPITTYPPALQTIVALTPLYQGIFLIRSLTLGDVGPQLIIPVAYMCAMGAIGLAICSRRLDLRLLASSTRRARERAVTAVSRSRDPARDDAIEALEAHAIQQAALRDEALEHADPRSPADGLRVHRDGQHAAIVRRPGEAELLEPDLEDLGGRRHRADRAGRGLEVGPVVERPADGHLDQLAFLSEAADARRRIVDVAVADPMELAVVVHERGVVGKAERLHDGQRLGPE